MPTKQQAPGRSFVQNPSQKAIAAGVMDVLKGLLPKQSKPRKCRGKPKRQQKRGTFISNGSSMSGQGAFASNSLGPYMPRQISGMSDIPDFEIAYNGADIVLGGATTTTAPGTLGIAFWEPKGPSSTGAILTGGLLPVAPADTFIGRTNVTDVFKHYERKVVTSVKVYLTPEITATNLNGLFAIAAVRGGSDTINCTQSASGTLTTFSDTDVMSLKNAMPFRIYDSVCYDATWAIAGGTGSKQNEFSILNTSTNSGTVVNSGVDGLGIIPCVLYIGGSSLGSSGAGVSGSNIVTHRCIIVVKVHLLDYRGTISLNNPLFKDPDFEEPPSFVSTCSKPPRSASHK